MTSTAAAGAALLAALAAGDSRAATFEQAAGAPAAGMPPPATLADGSRPVTLPPALKRFDGLPVVGARAVVRPSVPRWCGADVRDRRLLAWLSPDGQSVVYFRPRSRLARACDAVRVAGRWARCSVGAARSPDPRRVERAGGALGVCTRQGAWRAFMWIAPAPRSTWALVARRGYWVASATAGVALVRISATERGKHPDRLRTTVVFVDSHGRVLERRRVEGVVAG